MITSIYTKAKTAPCPVRSFVRGNELLVKTIPQRFDPETVALDLPGYEARYEQLTGDAMLLQGQLSNKALYIDGKRGTEYQYHQWRTRVVEQIQERLVEKRALKIAIHQARMLLEKDASAQLNGWAGKDFPLFCATTGKAIDELLRRIQMLHSTRPDDEDFTDLVEVSRESLEELRAYVVSVAQSDQVAS